MSLDTIDPDGSGVATWSLPRTPAVGNRHDPALGNEMTVDKSEQLPCYGAIPVPTSRFNRSTCDEVSNRRSSPPLRPADGLATATLGNRQRPPRPLTSGCRLAPPALGLLTLKQPRGIVLWPTRSRFGPTRGAFSRHQVRSRDAVRRRRGSLRWRGRRNAAWYDGARGVLLRQRPLRSRRLGARLTIDPSGRRTVSPSRRKRQYRVAALSLCAGSVGSNSHPQEQLPERLAPVARHNAGCRHERRQSAVARVGYGGPAVRHCPGWAPSSPYPTPGSPGVASTLCNMHAKSPFGREAIRPSLVIPSI